MALAVLSAGVAGAEAPVERVLLVTVDALRADHVGVYGGPVATPVMDALAAEGVLLEEAYTPIPATGPAHASLLTGLHPWRHRTVHSTRALDPRVRTLADVLQKRGITTAAFVSARYLDRPYGFHQGFGTFVFEPTQDTYDRGQRLEKFWSNGGATVDTAMAWITEHAAEPFFVWVHLFEPHAPHLAPPGYSAPLSQAVEIDEKGLPPTVHDADDLRGRIRGYRGEVAYVDAQLGRLIQRLRLLGLLDRTAVVVTADHGEGLGDHGQLQHEGSLFEENVRVPLLVRAPGVAPARRLRGFAQLEDLHPTVLSLLGAPTDPDRDGIDLLPWLRGEAEASPRSAVVGQRRPFRSWPDLFYRHDGSRKWVGGIDSPGLVFDLAADPDERAGVPGDGAPSGLRDAVALSPAPELEPPADAPASASAADPEARRGEP